MILNAFAAVSKLFSVQPNFFELHSWSLASFGNVIKKFNFMMTIFHVSRNRITETPQHYFTILWQNYADSRNPCIKSQTTAVIASRRPHQDQVLPLPPGDKSGHQTLEFNYFLVTYRQKTIKVVPRQQPLFSRVDGNLLALSRRIHFDVPSRDHEEIAGLVEEKGLIKMISRLEVDPQHGHARRTTHQLESQRCRWSPSVSVNTPGFALHQLAHG
jgi:hypothetical protein